MAKPTLAKSKKSNNKSFLHNKTRLEQILLVVLLIMLAIIIGLYFLLNKKSSDISQTATPVKQLADSVVNQQNTETTDPTAPTNDNTSSPTATNKSTTTASSSTSSTPSSQPAPAATPFSVSAVSASVNPASKFLTCNEYQNFTFTGTITATAAGNATYYWARSDGATGPPTTLNFAAAGSKQVTDTWLIGGYNEQGAFAISGWEKVVVTSPNAVSSNNATFNINFGCL